MFQIARVQDVIMDPLHPKFNGQSSIGSICYTLIGDPPPPDILQCEIAAPLNTNISHIPVPNEIVFLVSAPSKNFNEDNSLINYYLPPHAIHQDPNNNALPGALDSESQDFYKGNFKDIENIRPLVPFDGDILIEGRFGNSIRFGSTNTTNQFFGNEWSYEGLDGDPIIVIRNRQKNLDNRQVNNFDHIMEDINKDKSSIYLCSGQKLETLQLASLHDTSYKTDIFKENKKVDEPEITDNELTPDVTEDIELNTASPLPPKDKQITDELSTFKPTDVAYYDISPTEAQALSPQDALSLPSSYVIPDAINMNYIMEEM